MRFFLPDSQDTVDPTWDFEREVSTLRRGDAQGRRYAHEVLALPPYDGMLVSKAAVEGSARYSLAQRQRLHRCGLPAYLRLDQLPEPLPVMGDCGAFAYVDAAIPPYSPREVLDFYLSGRVRYGLSVDHIILGYDETLDDPNEAARVPETFRRRQEITLELAREFLAETAASDTDMVPMGVAQGWSPGSYADAVLALQAMGYEYIAMGGMVPLKTSQILHVLDRVQAIRATTTRLHLLGIGRAADTEAFELRGAASCDSTTPLRQAMLDDHKNYHLGAERYAAIRIPQTDGNPALRRQIASGAVKQAEARRLERDCLTAMRDWSSRAVGLVDVLARLSAYEALVGGPEARSRTEMYRRTLEARPWERCSCAICQTIGHHVIIFRGAERNRRRGFHNTWDFYRQVNDGLRGGATSASEGLLPTRRMRPEAPS